MSILPWSELTTTDFASLDRERAVAILPLGAIEQHGPHLPVGTDTRILEGLLARLRGQALARGTALVLPVQPVGLSPEHAAFPGTLTVGAETLLAFWCDLGRGVAAAGIGRLLILNSHGGNAALAEVAALRLRAETGLLVATVTTHRLGVPAEALPPLELRFGIHGGAVETALVQAIEPALVRTAALRPFPSHDADLAAAGSALGAAGGAARLAWLAQDLNVDGAMGDPTLASAALGEAILDHLTAAVRRVLDDVLALAPTSLRPVPGAAAQPLTANR